MAGTDLYPVAGMRFFLGGAKETQAEDFTAADFEDEIWKEVDGFETMGAAGDTAALIATDLINRGRTVKQKGVANAGQMQCNFAILAGDPGQTALIAAGAASNRNNYAVKIVGNDAPATGTDPKPSERLFVALVMGTPEQGGSANTVQMMQATLEINSNIVKVAATSGS
ncbi:hypothetical protein C7441_11011 [Pseudaminobacter salicylatoxidans]|uniref:Uncharacterized protein n=1 Tax=Pseudaminobacter salicylatoxidans TaxID=93369 RepID=A0A316C0F2_PSESE|nr:hypothetical protein [Pseudaminobacter salicylatoxidans]PWJ81480.1 hypothetical protein C7441_11011 [Pseudaminobacter salicylatoxidans]